MEIKQTINTSEKNLPESATTIVTITTIRRNKKPNNLKDMLYCLYVLHQNLSTNHSIDNFALYICGSLYIHDSVVITSITFHAFYRVSYRILNLHADAS